MFHRLGRCTASHPWTICALWLLAGAALALIAPRWDTRTQDDDVRFVPDRFTSVRAFQLMEKAFPQEVTASNLVFVVERENAPLTAADFALVDLIIKDLEQLRLASPELKIGKIDSCRDELVGSRLTSTDRHCTLIQVCLGTPYLALATADAVDRSRARVAARVAEAGAHAPHIYATGAAGVGRDLTRTCGSSLEGTTTATVILVIVVLLLVYRSPLLALIPLFTIAISVWVAMNVLALMTLLPGVHLVNISKIFAVVILYGAGTDYCLFLISRYREELEAGLDGREALEASVGGVGEALAASAGTVMVGLGLMALAEFAKVRYSGPAIALSLGVALLASLTLTPALLQLLGKVVFWPRKAPAPTRTRLLRQLRAETNGFWDRVSRGVAARPVLVWSLAILVLLPLAIMGARVKPNYCATNELSPRVDSLQGLAAIKRHFRAGEVGPITVLLESATNWDSRRGRLEIDHLSRGFAALPNVEEVRSLSQPLGSPFPNLTPLPDGEGFLHRMLVALQPTINAFLDDLHAKSRQHYVAEIQDDQGNRKYVTRMNIVLKSDPFAPESTATLRTIETWLKQTMPGLMLLSEPARAECFGVTANARDLAEVTEGDRHRVNTLVLAAIFLILVALVRNLWVAGYLLVTVLLSYYAALGATVLAGVLWTGAPLPHVDWRVPFFLFTILVAVGEDYNILLVTRALQERKNHGAVEGMRRALARTGGAITSCGLIMAGTFATLMLAGLNTLLQIGFALAVGVLIDTFIVRPFLVPAFAMMFWRGGAATHATHAAIHQKSEHHRAPHKHKWEHAA
jgi:RND superfamily putative drug exporter